MLKIENNPWLGLESYSVEDSIRFYGRDSDVEIVANTIYDNYITTIYGISGAGKTSLINAGITPVLTGKGYLPIRIRLKHRSEESYSMQIINAICTSIESIGGEIEYEGSLEIGEICEKERLWFFLHTRKYWTGDNYPVTPVLFIDQFEEIFTQQNDLERVSDFFETISSIQQDTPPKSTKCLMEDSGSYVDLIDNRSRMVFIIREDFLPRMEDYSFGIPALRRNRIGIKRMNGFQALDVILKPYPGIITEDGAIKILSKVSGKDVTTSSKCLERLSVDTSILSLFCSELYQKASDCGLEVISESLIEESGDDIMSHFYEKSMSLVSTALAEYLETHLLTSSGFRNSVAYEDIIIPKMSREKTEQDIRLLAEKRILRVEDVDGVVRVEFTHDVLCKEAKSRRDAIKEEGDRKRQVRRNVLKTFEQVVTFILSGVFLLCAFLYDRSLFQDYLRPDWLLACGLFFVLFVSPVFSNKKYVNFGLSVVLSFLLARLPVGLMFPYSEGPRFFLWFVSVFLSALTFLGKNGERKFISYLLITLDIILALRYNRFSLLGVTIIFWVLLATIPLKYSNDKNTWKISLIVSGIICVAAILFNCVPFVVFAFYPLLGVTFRQYGAHEPLVSSLKKCLRLEVLLADRRWVMFLSVTTAICTLIWCEGMMNEQSDILSVYYAPIVALVLFYSVGKVLDLLPQKGPLSRRPSEDPALIKRALTVAALSGGVLMCRYIPYGFICVLTIWGLVAGVLARNYWRSRSDQNVFLGLIRPLLLTSLCVVVVPLCFYGYDASSHIKYAKAISKNLYQSVPLVVIKDMKGNYGVRDRYNVIVPVEYSDVDPGVYMTIENYTYKYGKDYKCVNREDSYFTSRGLERMGNIAIDRLTRFRSYSFGSPWSGSTYAFPEIVFYLRDSAGRSVKWRCSDHLSEHNLCTSAILRTAEDCITLGRKYNSLTQTWGYYDFDEEHAGYFIDRIKQSGGNASDFAKKLITHNIERKDIDSTDAVRLSYKVLSYVEDTAFVRYCLDSLYVPQKRMRRHERWSYYDNMARYHLYSNQPQRAEQYAKMAIREDFVLIYAYKNLIVAYLLQGEYEKAYGLLENYGDGMHYMGAFTQLISGDDFELDIIHGRSNDISPALRFDNLYNGVINELTLLRRFNVDMDTQHPSFIEFEEYVKSKCIRPYDSAEDKGGYYLCRKYDYYADPLDEWYGGARPPYKLEYQFYMKDNVQISPVFDTYAKGKDDNIMLIIDQDDKKRKFIDMSGDVPRMIPGSYDHAWRFSEGLAAVVTDGRLGFIDRNGRFVIDRKFTYENDPRYRPDRYNRQHCHILDYTFRDGLCLMKAQSGKYGLIDKRGNWVVEPIHERVKYIKSLDLWLLKKKDLTSDDDAYLFGAVDGSGKVMVPVKYNDYLMTDGFCGYWGDGEDYISISDPSHRIFSNYKVKGNEIIQPSGRVIEYNSYEMDRDW